MKVLISDSTLGMVDNELGVFIVGIVTAFLSGLFAIRFLLKFLSRHSLVTFAYYRFAVGALVLAILVF
jgi:undecaprenyl-diphosphatase